jgi:hypothetical protein
MPSNGGDARRERNGKLIATLTPCAPKNPYGLRIYRSFRQVTLDASNNVRLL